MTQVKTTLKLFSMYCSKCYSDLSKCVAVGGSRVLTVEEGTHKYGMGEGKKEPL